MQMPPVPITQETGQLDIFIQKQKEIDGIGMGVLSDGTAFLNGRGLARLCGVNNARIVELGQDWDKESTALTQAVKKSLAGKGISIGAPYVELRQSSGSFYAYPDFVCLAVLEHYAFDNPKQEAQQNFRILAGRALYEFICTQVGYDPRNVVSDQWRQFHDRVSLTYGSVHPGYFGVFKEISDMIVALGQQGIQISSNFVPDISVGQAWAKHWAANNLEAKFGARIKWDHNYPDYFPQAASNPQQSWCYPESALGEFRAWMRNNYIGQGKLFNYINTKVRNNELPPSFVQLAKAAYRIEE